MSDKKSSIIHHDLLAVVEEMPDEMAGRFIKAIYQLMQGQSTLVDDFALKMALHPFVAQFQRDKEKYDKICERNRINGALGGRPPNNPENPDGLSETQKTQANPENPDNDNDNDNDNDSDNDKKDIRTFSAVDFLSSKNVKKETAREWLKVRAKKRLANTETAFEKILLEMDKKGLSYQEGFTLCVQESWGGFKASWPMPEQKTHIDIQTQKELRLQGRA